VFDDVGDFGVAVGGVVLEVVDDVAVLIEGHHKKTAAREMGISTNTVFFHLKYLFKTASPLED